MKALGYLYIAIVATFLLAPVMVLVPLSFDGSIVPSLPPSKPSFAQYVSFFRDASWMRALGVSARVAGISMVCSLVLGTLAAFALVRSRFRGKAALGAVLLAPRFTPVIIIALALYAFFASLRLVGTEAGLVLAHTVMSAPYVVIIVSASLRGFDRSLEQASLSLGATPLATALKITLPLTGAALLSAALVAFIVSFDEIVVAIFIAGTHAATLPKKMWDSLVYEMEPSLPAISTLILATTTVGFIVVAGLRMFFNRRSTIPSS